MYTLSDFIHRTQYTPSTVTTTSSTTSTQGTVIATIRPHVGREEEDVDGEGVEDGESEGESDREAVIAVDDEVAVGSIGQGSLYGQKC